MFNTPVTNSLHRLYTRYSATNSCGRRRSHQHGAGATAITVVDKNGKFVEGLERGDFELLIDGKPRPISFLERITAASEREAQLSSGKQLQPSAPVTANSTVRGRTIIFYIDDLHLSFNSLHRTRQMITHFVDNEMSSKDSVAIASATGQIGFLQQFTNNKDVLRAALAMRAHKNHSLE